MKIVLLQPPHWDPSHPYLSLPSLAAHLRARGHEVVMLDASVDCFEHFLSPAVLEAHYRQVLDRMDELAARPALTADEREELALLAKVNAHAPVSIGQVPDACRRFRSDGFYDYETYWRCMMIFFRATEIISACHFPSRLTFAEFGMRYRGAYSEEVLQAMHDRRENPFLPFFERYVSERVLSEDPALIGISFTAHSQLIPGLTLARVVAEQAPDIPLVAGGAHVSTLLADGANFKPFFEYVDGFCCYGGEGPMEYLARSLEQGAGGVESVPNFAHYRDGRVAFNKPLLEESLAQLLTPDFEGMPFGSYFAPDLNLPLIASKGCYWGRCAFCGYCTSTKDMAHFQRPVPSVVQDIATLKERHHCHAFSFGDDCISPERCMEISRGLLERRLDVAWDVFTRHDIHFTPQICEAMAQSGCKRVYFGFESGNERILKLMRKGTDLKLIAEVWRRFKESGISVHAFCMGGFPTETEADAQDTVKFLCDHHEQCDSISFLPFTLIPPSRIAKDPAAFGVELTDTDADFDAGSLPYAPGCWHPRGNAYVAFEYLPARVMDGLRARGNAGERYQHYEHVGYVAEDRCPPLKGHEFLYYAFPKKLTPRPPRAASEEPLPPRARLRLASRTHVSEAPHGDHGLLYNGNTGRVTALAKAAHDALRLCTSVDEVQEVVARVLAKHGAGANAAAQVNSLLARLVAAGVLERVEPEPSGEAKR